jgi:vacuolar-type H+-ATPase subunit H
MLEDTIQVIKETESNARKIVKDADMQCNKILEEAADRAKKIKIEELDATNKKAEKIREAARKKGDEYQKERMLELESEIRLLKEEAFKNEKKAISLITAQLT